MERAKPLKERVIFAPSYSNHQFCLKKHKSTFVRDDNISKLPDEILIIILSRLTFKEAARTCIISHRWERLWISYHGCLDFGIRKPLCRKKKFWPREWLKYILKTNQVMRKLLLSGSSSFTALTVCLYHCEESEKIHIDEFVKFAMAIQFQSLEFDMEPMDCAITGRHYDFPVEFYDWIKQPCGLHKIIVLQSISLKYVNVNGEFVEFILTNCPLLEHLSVVESTQLLELKVIDAPRLKYLQVIQCHHMTRLEVSSTPNLMSLNYIGSAHLQVENVPKLVEVTIGHNVIYYLSGSLSTYLPQVQTLELFFSYEGSFQFTPVVVLSQLKHLVLRVCINDQKSLLGLISLIDASPFLHKIKLEAISDDNFRKKNSHHINKATTQNPHQSLKVVEFVAFSGLSPEMDLAVHCLKNATTLEQIIINLGGASYKGTIFETPRNDHYFKFRVQRALMLKKYLPPRVDLVII